MLKLSQHRVLALRGSPKFDFVAGKMDGEIKNKFMSFDFGFLVGGVKLIPRVEFRDMLSA